MKAEGGEIGHGADASRSCGGAEGMRGVVDDRQAVTRGDPAEADHRRRPAREVHRQERRRARRHRGVGRRGIDVQRGEIDVGQHRRAARVDDRVDRRAEGVGGGDDLTAGLDAGGEEREVQGGGAGVDGDRMLGASVGGHGRLEGLDLGSGRQPARLQDVEHGSHLGIADVRRRERDDEFRGWLQHASPARNRTSAIAVGEHRQRERAEALTDGRTHRAHPRDPAEPERRRHRRAIANAGVGFPRRPTERRRPAQAPQPCRRVGVAGLEAGGAESRLDGRERRSQHIAPHLVAEVVMRGGQHRTRRGRQPGVERREQRSGEIDGRAAAVGADHDEQRIGPLETHGRVQPRIAADAEERPAAARVAPLGGDLGRPGRRADDGDELAFGLEDLYAIVAAIGDRHERDPFDVGILAFEARRHDDHVRRLIELTGSRARFTEHFAQPAERVDDRNLVRLGAAREAPAVRNRGRGRQPGRALRGDACLGACRDESASLCHCVHPRVRTVRPVDSACRRGVLDLAGFYAKLRRPAQERPAWPELQQDRCPDPPADVVSATYRDWGSGATKVGPRAPQP